MGELDRRAIDACSGTGRSWTPTCPDWNSAQPMADLWPGSTEVTRAARPASRCRVG
jgi:hypothetical protein